MNRAQRGTAQAIGEAVNESREETGQVKKHILLADDDPGVRELLGRVLESEHYQVTFARTGREAAAKFASDLPDIVLLDINMPDKDGWAAFRLMNTAHTLVPVIVITARPNQYPQARELGVDAFMEKPLNLPVLFDTIRRLLAEPEAERTRRLIDPNFNTEFLNDISPRRGEST
jgi:DNA-binding response OmpR family regulator